MIDPRLVSYIKSALSKGIPLNQIKKDLISKGWPPYDVDSAISATVGRRTHIETKPHQRLEGELDFRKIYAVAFVLLLVIGGTIYFLTKDEKRGDKEVPKTEQNTSQLASSAIIDCGTDMECLVKKSEKCEPAKLTNNVTTELFGMIITTTSFYEIRGTEANKCVLYLRTENQDIDFSEEFIQQAIATGITQEEIEQQKQEANKQNKLIVNGLDGTCKFGSNSDLTSLLGKWKDSNFSGGVSCSLGPEGNECTSTGDWSIADCEGKMFEGTTSQ